MNSMFKQEHSGLGSYKVDILVKTKTMVLTPLILVKLDCQILLVSHRISISSYFFYI